MNRLLPYQKIESGNTYTWDIALEKYSSNEYVLSCVFKTISLEAKTITATQVGTGYRLKLNATDWEAGKYKVHFYLTNAELERITIGICDLDVEADLSEVNDPRSYNQKCLEAIELVLSGSCDNSYLETIFKDSTFKYRSTTELIKLKNHFKILVDLENGIKPGRIVIC
jgi:hypothetical protein